MPSIQAFHGLRYDLGQVGSLTEVVAPPYDVIDSAMQKQLYEGHPANVVRLILNREEPGDDNPDNRYKRAARFLKVWRQEGVLQREPQAAVYYYQQIFSFGGQEFARSGFMSRVRLEPFGEGKIFPHEETHSAAKADRLKLITSCQANLSQVFGIYPDPENQVEPIFGRVTAGVAPLEATDHLGVVHRVWPITDEVAITELSAVIDPKPLFIADGHHRYETACNYRDQLAQGGQLPDNHPANFVLMMCVGMSDPGMIVLPTHRLFRGLSEMSSEELSGKLGDDFSVTDAGPDPDAAREIWAEIEAEDEQGTIAFYTAKDNRWLLARISPKGQEKMSQIAADHSADWQGLGVSILHRLIVETLLGATDLPKPMYVHSVDEVIEALKSGDTVGRDATGQAGQGGRFPLAAMVMPATLDHIRKISEYGERMPAKSTYFYPKLLSGLVINPLD